LTPPYFCTYNKNVETEIEFDPAKDAENITKHGISLAEAPSLAWEESWAWPETRFGYGEWRMSALVPGGNHLYFVSCVERGEAIRVITARVMPTGKRLPFMKETIETRFGRKIVPPTPEEDVAITAAAALSDPDAAPLTDSEWKTARQAASICRAAQGARHGASGRGYTGRAESHRQGLANAHERRPARMAENAPGDIGESASRAGLSRPAELGADLRTSKSNGSPAWRRGSLRSSQAIRAERIKNCESFTERQGKIK
jgi:uncharacterized DUF497 family protein